MTQLHLAVALDGAGWHPAAWRLPSARPAELTSAGYWTDLVQEAEGGLLDFVTIEDAMSVQSSSFAPDGRSDQVRGRLDAVLVAARVAPRTAHIGLVPTATVTHTEPFHVSKGGRHPRLRQWRPRRMAGAGVRARERGAALRSAARRAVRPDGPGRS